MAEQDLPDTRGGQNSFSWGQLISLDEDVGYPDWNGSAGNEALRAFSEARSFWAE